MSSTFTLWLRMEDSTKSEYMYYADVKISKTLGERSTKQYKVELLREHKTILATQHHYTRPIILVTHTTADKHLSIYCKYCKY